MQPAPWSQGPSHLGLELSSPGVGVGRSVGELKPQNRLDQVSGCTAWPPVPLMTHWLRTPGGKAPCPHRADPKAPCIPAQRTLPASTPTPSCGSPGSQAAPGGEADSSCVKPAAPSLGRQPWVTCPGVQCGAEAATLQAGQAASCQVIRLPEAPGAGRRPAF